MEECEVGTREDGAKQRLLRSDSVSIHGTGQAEEILTPLIGEGREQFGRVSILDEGSIV